MRSQRSWSLYFSINTRKKFRIFKRLCIVLFYYINTSWIPNYSLCCERRKTLSNRSIIIPVSFFKRKLTWYSKMTFVFILSWKNGISQQPTETDLANLSKCKQLLWNEEVLHTDTCLTRTKRAFLPAIINMLHSLTN